MPATRVPRALLIALACVVVAMVALPFAAQPFIPPPDRARAVAPSRHALATATAQAAYAAHRTGTSIAGDDAGTPVRADLAVAAARAQVGAPYSASGDTPRTGFSCVGLVHWAYVRAGIAVPESESELAAAYPAVPGATATGAGLRPGDILLYRDTGWAGLSHASIYAGDGLMVSADSPQSGVRLEPIGDAYWVSHWAGAVRVPAAQRPLRLNPAVGW